MLMRYQAARTGAIVDHHLLPDTLAQFVGDATRHHIGGATGRKFHHHAHRAFGVFGGICCGGQQPQT